jgi:hypothetical protein
MDNLYWYLQQGRGLVNICYFRRKNKTLSGYFQLYLANLAGYIKLGATDLPMDKIQIITIEDLFANKQPQLPGAAENESFKKAKRNEGKGTSKGLFD